MWDGMTEELLAEIVKEVITIAGYVSAVFGAGVAVITFFTLIIKPLRKGAINWVARIANRRETENVLANLQSSVSEIQQGIGNMSDTIKNNADIQAANIDDLGKKVLKLEAKVLENEADRLRSELFDCGNRCRRGIRLHPEEMEHIRAVFKKYSKDLKQNGTGESEYNFICEYYNHQHFPEYHSTNKISN
jgi:hypothetical protein